MSIRQRIVLNSALFVACALLRANSFAQLVIHPPQVWQFNNGVSMIAHGDFNNDGREDLAVSNYITTSTGPENVTYQLLLSNGADYSYQAPVALPASIDAVGDFNGDGNLDFASFHTGTLFVYLGNGDGTFQSPQTVTTTTPYFLVSADMNHDGKTDLVAFNNGNPSTLQIWISSGNGTFSSGQAISLPNEQAIPGSNLITGDFDGDSKPDVAFIRTTGNPSGTTVQVWYGDGAGHLGSPYIVTDPKKLNDVNAFAADLNSDGRSDIIATLNTYNSDGQLLYLPNVALFSGNANRTLKYSQVVTQDCPEQLVVADFNGDGINDLLFNQSTCPNPPGGTVTVIKLGQGSNTFAQKHIVNENFYGTSGFFVVRTSLGTRPDVIYSVTDGVTFSELNMLQNLSTGGFPGCGPSGFSQGIQICAPEDSATSPVQFSVGTAGPTPMRTASIWVDRKKVAEQLTHAFSNYSFLDTSVPLAAGSHRVTVIAAGWDGSQLQKTVTLTVAGGTSCSAPTTPGVNLCQPLSGSTVSSPVVVQAAANVTGTIASTQLWVDGVKTFNAPGSITLTTSVSLAAGTHRFAVIATNTTGQKWESAVNATVK